MNEHDIISSVTPKLSHLVIKLMRDCEVGICAGHVKLSDLNCGCPTVSDAPGKCDRFKVTIPFAGQTLTWEVLFDEQNPEDPPDFIFGSDEFFPNIDRLPSLVDWDFSEPASLTHVINELVIEYRRYQERLVSEIERLNFEYTSLLEGTAVTPDTMEIHVSRTENRVGPINFLIKLHVDFSKIPEYMVKLNLGEDAALLLVTYHTAEGSRITPQLYMSHRLEKALGGGNNLRIPVFPEQSCLSDYVQDVTLLLQNKVDTIVNCFEKRRDYINAFLEQFGRSVLEFDSVSFTKVGFLFEWHDFFFMVNIELPAMFPKEKPSLTLQSIYHEQKGRPYSEPYPDYPYSPRWNGAEMADRIRQYILEHIGTFQKKSVTCGRE
ncbi:BRISC and BRCA1-A complex member 2-like [Mya arenaria]|nr:BRISC and BRCA1-A complex member 2-like [Mya arenaria]